ncbi:ferredoxin family protein [Caldilinea sp.]|uniref:4Fe-4S dicluster domain-containing protein n=1 Tax=Caldilinea sp. TaxID=2293560 RepID=UPI002C245DA4|nr:ferredoxin family protein [Anaerolineales bacterium]HQY94729.1 ferredoxin family protein [Caldilinea sp.]
MAKGTVTIQTDRCKGCGLCIQACPQHVLAFTEEFNARGYRPVQLDERAHACTGCGVCAVVCPDVVFTVYRQPVRRAA